MTIANGILDADALGVLYPRGLSGRRVLFLTDSIGNGSNASNVIYAYPQQSLLQAGQMLFPIAISTVNGNPGYRTDQMVPLLVDAITASQADVVVFQGGPNNAAQGTAIAQYIADIKAVAKICRDRSLPFVIVNVPPMAAAASTAKQLALQAMNAWASLNVPALGGVIADVWTALANSATGALLAGYVSGVDEVHPNDSGHSRMAGIIATALKAAVPLKPKSAMTAVFDANMVTNTLMTGALGVGAPTGWFSVGSPAPFGDAAVTSIVAATAAGPDRGQLLEIDMNATTQNSAFERGTTLTAAKYAANDLLLVEWYQEQENVSGVSDPDALPVAGNGARLRVFNGTSGVNILTPARSAGLSGYHSLVFQVPATNPALGLAFGVTSNTGRRIKGRIGQVGVINLTQLGLAAAIPA